MQHIENTALQTIFKTIDTLPKTSPVPRLIYSYLKRNMVKREINLSLAESAVSFNKKNLDLSKRKKIFRIFEVFLKQDRHQISRSSLIDQVYTESANPHSTRQKICHNHNVVKLISRARRLAAKAFREEGAYSNIHWFPYDPSSRSWHLYMIKDDQFLETELNGISPAHA